MIIKVNNNIDSIINEISQNIDDIDRVHSLMMDATYPIKVKTPFKGKDAFCYLERYMAVLANFKEYLIDTSLENEIDLVKSIIDILLKDTEYTDENVEVVFKHPIITDGVNNVHLIYKPYITDEKHITSCKLDGLHRIGLDVEEFLRQLKGLYKLSEHVEFSFQYVFTISLYHRYY